MHTMQVPDLKHLLQWFIVLFLLKVIVNIASLLSWYLITTLYHKKN